MGYFSKVTLSFESSYHNFEINVIHKGCWPKKVATRSAIVFFSLPAPRKTRENEVPPEFQAAKNPRLARHGIEMDAERV